MFSRRTPMTLALAAAMALLAGHSASAGPAGQQAYAARCSMCHQPSGAGLAGQFPRLAGRLGKMAAKPEGRRYLALVLLHGLYGPITVDGRAVSGVMPTMGSMSDAAIADLLNHAAALPAPTRGVAPFTAAEVAKVRAEGRKSGSDVAVERARLAAKGLMP